VRVRSLIGTIAVLAAAGAAGAGLAVPSAGASVSTAAAPGGVAPPGVTLHVKASGVSTGKPSGLVRPRDSKAVKNSGSGNLLYHGGQVQSDEHEYLIFWGDWWTSGCAAQQGHGGTDETYLYNYWHGMGAPGDGLSGVQTQYGDSSGDHPVYPTTLGHAFAGWAAYCDPAVPAAATDAQLAAVAKAYAAYLTSTGVVINRSTQIDVVSPSGTNPGGGFGSQYCAYHNVTVLPSGADLSWTNMPYLPDQGASCGAGFLPTGPSPALQGWSIVGGHEYAEAATDPFTATGLYAWYDAAGEEIGDKCAWQGIFTEATAGGSFVQQPEWSNAISGCAQTSRVSDTITMQRGVSLASVHGQPVTFGVYGHSAHGYSLAWSATGLPAGLSINAGTGLISGTPTTAGTWTVHVTAHDTAYAYNTATTVFTWKVS
jgi:hypothetical protein